MVINLLVISLIVCYVVDVSGFVDHIKQFIWKWLMKKEYNGYQLKPFDCSRCMCFWVGLIYIICVGFNLWNLLLVCGFSLMAEQITNLLVIFQMLLQKLEDKIVDYLE